MRKKSSVVKSALRPLWVMVPSHSLREASRLFSATMWVCMARPSGIAPRLIAMRSRMPRSAVGVQPEFWT